jgi:hypothetical protein
MPAPPGKDADPKEYPRYFKGRGRRLAVIGARDFGCNVAARPTSYAAARCGSEASTRSVAAVNSGSDGRCENSTSSSSGAG